MREAIIHHAFDYCLKPIDPANAEEILERLKKKLDEEFSEIEQGDDISNESFKRLIEYINLNYKEPLKLSTLASMFYINANYCCHLFNKHYNMSFSKYVNNVRIEAAKKLMNENRTLSIAEVSEMCGYVSYQHFNKKFKEIVGMLPSDYKRGK